MNSEWTLPLLETLIILCTVKNLGTFIYNLISKQHMLILHTGAIQLILGFVLTVIASSMEKDRISHQPYLLLLLALVYLTLCVLTALVSYKISRNGLGRDSVVAAFDKMDVGLCYYDESGQVILCNELMHAFSQSIMQCRVLNGRNFQQKLLEITEATSDKDVYRLENDGKNYYISIKKLKTPNLQLTEMKCTDVTELHSRTEQLAHEKSRLQDLNARLLSYGEIADKTTREQEVLNAKIKLHDSFGALLLQAKRAMEAQESDEKIQESINSLKDILSCMSVALPASEDLFGELEKAANSIGVQLHQNNQVSVLNDKQKQLIYPAVKECLTNAVRHGAARNIYINILPAPNGHIEAEITNDGKKPESSISMGTGLSSLKAKIEKAGGSISIEEAPEFKLKITL